SHRLPRSRVVRSFPTRRSSDLMVHDTAFGYRYGGDPAAWDGWRTYTLAGEENDGNAYYAHGGVAGHAGLFSTAAELRVLLDLLRSEEHTSELQSRENLVCRLLL